jgi:hypothetical protein
MALVLPLGPNVHEYETTWK